MHFKYCFILFLTYSKASTIYPPPEVGSIWTMHRPHRPHGPIINHAPAPIQSEMA